MRLSARRELLASVQHQYTAAACSEKKSILGGFVTIPGYSHKHAITLLRSTEKHNLYKKRVKSTHQYDGQVRQTLFTCGTQLTKYALSS